MARIPPADGLRDLSLIRASGSTARVLNLALVHERAGQSEDFLAKPLFRCARLNRVLIVKHAVRAHERDLFDAPEPHTTKIIFPFSSTELGIGGTSLMMGEKGFEQALRHALGEGLNAAQFEEDFDLLCVLHDLPSFDPFMMREQLRRNGREPARCFFELSDADVAAMIDFVAAEITPLIAMAFGATGRRVQKLSLRLAEKLMTDESAQVLEPLREAVRLAPAQYREGVFAWKGFLYYKWLLVDLVAHNASFAKAFMRCVAPGADVAARTEIDRLKREIIASAEHVLVEAQAAVQAYDSAFAQLVRGHATEFRDFLISAPGRFIALGEATGALKHVHSLWGYRFPEQTYLAWEPAEALDTLRDFSRMFAGIELIHGEAERDLCRA